MRKSDLSKERADPVINLFVCFFLFLFFFIYLSALSFRFLSLPLLEKNVTSVLTHENGFTWLRRSE